MYIHTKINRLPISYKITILMCFFFLVEPENEEQNSEHLFRMSRIDWGPCKDCVMKNSSK